MRSSIVSMLMLLLLGLLLLAGWLWLMQPRMVFYPVRQLVATPADWGMHYQEVRLRSSDGLELHGWYLPRAGAERVLLFLHGNAGNISHRRESLQIFHRLGLNVLIVDYRGYGHSQGAPDEAGLYQDARAAWDYLSGQRGFNADQILVFGRSLGAAVAAHLVAGLPAQAQPRGLILESSFSSAADMARRAFPLLHWLVPLRYRFDTAARLRRVRCPVLVLHSPDDEIIPFALGEKVFAAANPPKTLWRMRGDHNGGFLISQPGYEQALASFLAEDQQ